MSKRKSKVCACCGNYAGNHHQWWNQDDGYGICIRCAKKEKIKNTEEWFYSCYGQEEIHFNKL